MTHSTSGLTDSSGPALLSPSSIVSQLAGVRAFIVYRLLAQADGSLDKVPTNPLTGRNCNPHDPNEWMLPDEAAMWAEQMGREFGVGVVISEQITLPNGMRMFCLDLDKCRNGDRWLPHAASFCARFPGAAIEVSVSCNGLHVYGTYRGPRPQHGVKNKTYKIELYTRLRFIAITGVGAMGSVLIDHTDALHALAKEFFPPRDEVEYGDTLTEAPVPEWVGPADDDELLRRALRSHSAASVFGGKASFADLWNANANVLARVFPPFKNTAYDESGADLALANHLAFWTGNHGVRLERIMRRSQLVRDKWDNRAGYLVGTINRACGSQRQWYTGRASDAPIDTAPATSIPPAAGTGAVIPEAQHLCTDQANAQRLQQRYSDRLITCAGTFYTWDTKRWKADDSLPQRFACELSKIVRDEEDAVLARVAAAQSAISAEDVRAHLQHPRLNPLSETVDGARLFELEEIAKALGKWSKECEMKSKQDAALGLLKKLLSVDVNRLDADPWLLNCENGTVDLRTGQLREHRAADFITKLAPVTYNPAAQAPRFLNFLDDIFVSNNAVIEFVQRWHGYAATGNTRDHYLVIHWGAGSNGKSTLIKAVESVLGDYATAAPTGLLTAKDSDGRHPSEIAKLHGKRLVTASESEDGAKLREAFVKNMTGGDTLTGRRMYGEWFDFRPTHKLQLFTNSKPQIRGSDYGIWRRILLVPYTVKFGSADEVAAGEVARLKDTSLGDALEGEKPGILNWLIEGARRWYSDGGLHPPDVVLAASREYREEQDRLGEFIRDCCQLDAQARQPLPELYRAYRNWCAESGIDHAFTRQRFVNELEQRVPGFVRPKKSHGTNYVRGIALIASVPALPFVPPPPPPPPPMPAATPIPPAPPQMGG